MPSFTKYSVIISLPVLPSIIHEIQAVINDSDVSVDALANMLTREIGFSLFTLDMDLTGLDSAKRLNLDSDTLHRVSGDVLRMMKDSANTF